MELLLRLRVRLILRLRSDSVGRSAGQDGRNRNAEPEEPDHGEARPQGVADARPACIPSVR